MKIWLEKKGNPFGFFFYESNIIDFNHNTRWINFGSINPCFSYLVGYGKPKMTSRKWVIHILRKKDGFT